MGLIYVGLLGCCNYINLQPLQKENLQQAILDCLDLLASPPTCVLTDVHPEPQRDLSVAVSLSCNEGFTLDSELLTVPSLNSTCCRFFKK